MKKPVKKFLRKKRPDWDEYFLKIVSAVGSRATCDRGNKGCVLIRDSKIISTGYLGSASGLPHCSEVGHDKAGEENYCRRTIHAEHNAITQALHSGISLERAVMYCEIEPCSACSKMAESLGIKKIITRKRKK